MTLNDLQHLEVGPFYFYCNMFLLQLKITQPDALGVKTFFFKYN